MTSITQILGGDAADNRERTLADRAYGSLHDSIVTGVLSAGERLTIGEVAEALGMSPMPIREALRRLDGVGLVERIPHRGARVTELSLDDLVDVYQARLALEVLAVKEGAEKLSDEESVLATEALRNLERTAKRGGAKVLVAHTEFHFSLYRAAHSLWLIRLITPLWESSERYRLSLLRNRRLAMRENEHEEILAAVLARKPQRAGALMYNHLATTANELAREMGSHEPFAPMRVPR